MADVYGRGKDRGVHLGGKPEWILAFLNWNVKVNVYVTYVLYQPILIFFFIRLPICKSVKG